MPMCFMGLVVINKEIRLLLGYPKECAPAKIPQGETLSSFLSVDLARI